MDLQALVPTLLPIALDENEAASIEAERVAAVAICLRTLDEGAEVLLMRRATRPGDRWSGQIGLPGGHREPEDADLLATAVRETREEVGADLHTYAEPLGRLEAVRAKARGKVLSMSIVPFLFRASGPMKLVMGPEADEAFWFPLHEARAGNLDTSHTYRGPKANFHMPAWDFAGRVVWGLTYEILAGLHRRFDAVEGRG